jgi:D-alanyl-D-alanine carboxypeptidase
VADPDGVWAGAFGVDGAGEPLAAQAAMPLASVTKTFTAAQVLQLVEEGLVDLDRPVSDYVSVPFDTRGATVGQLLGMRSGFPDPTDDVIAAAASDLERSWTGEDWYPLVDTTQLERRKVGQPTYNNFNYVVLGELIETVTGLSYAKALRRDLLDPAGLDRIWVQDDEQPVPPTAIGTEDPQFPIVDEDGPFLPSRSIASAAGAAGGIAADAPTLAAWGVALYSGKIFDPATVTLMTTPPDGDTQYGLGTEVDTDTQGQPIVGHGGDIVGVSTSLLRVWLDEGITIAVLSPQGPAKPLDALAQRLHTAAVDQHLKTPATP